MHLLRNKLARTPGQGTSRRRKVITGVSGSQTGPSGGKFVRLAIPELVQAGGAISGTSGAVNWPLNLPGTGSQDAVDLNIPYRFWGLSENLSWLAQFSGQGQSRPLRRATGECEPPLPGEPLRNIGESRSAAMPAAA